jgi:hypothetical protein
MFFAGGTATFHLIEVSNSLTGGSLPGQNRSQISFFRGSDMSSPTKFLLLRHAGIACAVLLVAAGFAGAQTTETPDQSATAGFSSSNDSRLPQIAELAMPSGLASLAPVSMAAVSQDRDDGYGRDGRYDRDGGWRKNAMNSLAFELGGGINAPTDKNYITWGGNFTLGAGVNFNKQFAMLAEYQFIVDKLPGKLIAQTGANGGNAHIWSLTLSPVVSLFPKSSNDIYLTGGGGFYRKVTNFTNPALAQYCNYFYCGVITVNQVVGHFSSNQPGWNIGGGYQHRMGGMFNDSKMKFFAEARYLKIYTPRYSNQPNGLGTATVAADTVLVPITVGVRW